VGMNLQGLYGAVPLSHFLLKERVLPGDRAIDATCGNGQDTLLLAKLVGAEGKVWAFDIQAEALARTKEGLEAADFVNRVNLVHAGHERMAEFVAEPVKAILFNLGYLPTGEHEIKTSAESTVTALEQGKKLLLPSGIILVAVYTGHEGGEAEWSAVKAWSEGLGPHEFNVWQARQLNRSKKAPFLVMVEKMPVSRT
jgi:SAM-dependent methyltransferase